jgi:hypothetical protein
VLGAFGAAHPIERGKILNGYASGCSSVLVWSAPAERSGDGALDALGAAIIKIEKRGRATGPPQKSTEMNCVD